MRTVYLTIMCTVCIYKLYKLIAIEVVEGLRTFIYLLSYRLKELERGFVLDGTVVSRLANDETGRSHPSLNMGIPQYNALHDKHCKSYFKSKGPPKSVRATKSLTSAIPEDSEDNSSMMGQVFDKFVRNSSAKQYLQEREGIGAGELSHVNECVYSEEVGHNHVSL